MAHIQTVRPAQDAAPPNGAGEAAVAAESAAPSYVYALGRIEARFPTLAVEKEFAQAVRSAETRGLADQAVIHSVLTDRANRYLAKKICWVMTIEGLETYLLQPADTSDLDLLIESIRPNKARGDVDLVIGVRGPMAPPEACNGLIVPMVSFSQIYSFDVESLASALEAPPEMEAAEFRRVSAQLFDRFPQMADNAGATDEHRAVNYLSVRYEQIYRHAVEMHDRDFALQSFDTRPSRLSGARNIVDVIFTFRSRKTDLEEKYFVRVDVTEEFPFVHTPLTAYFDR